MIAYFILGLSLLIGFVLLARWFVATDPRYVASVARWVAAGLGVLAGGYLLWGGRQALAALALPMLIPLLLRYRALWHRIKAAQGPSPGQTSEVDTRFVKMTLDHDSGVMDGVVLEGRLRGRRLGQLSLDELLELWRECQGADAQSAAVLEAYLDRTQGEAWRAAAGAGAGDRAAAPGGGAMARDEAYHILGLEPGASDAEILEAHRRLMQKIHPDHGGSNYLAAKINQAKETLLGG
ncbi:MAG: DnaJ domain-containing protein [Kiloniellaceae bacterium]